jgi:hypothetical protein
MRNALRMLLPVTAAAALLLPAAAAAHRSPTRHERTLIIGAAIAAEGGKDLRVRVAQIAVSTVAHGFWAAATVSIYRKGNLKKPEMVARDAFFKARGKWFDTTIRNRTPSNAVASDLGLQASGSPHRATPSSEYRVSKHTLREIAIYGGAGFVLLLIIGRIAGAYADSGASEGGGSTPEDHGTGATRSSEPGWSSPQPRQPQKQLVTKTCPSCRNGLTPCFSCGSSGQVPDPTTGEMLTCGACGGHGGFPCSPCSGRGWIQEYV